jgi:hypothetical protein
MSYEFTGKLIEKFDAVQITEKFKKREFVVEKDEQNGSFAFNNVIMFQLSNDRCAAIDPFEKGMEVKVTFNIRGRKWEKDGRSGYASNLEAWKVELVSAASSSASVGQGMPPIPSEAESPVAGSDDLPF